MKSGGQGSGLYSHTLLQGQDDLGHPTEMSNQTDKCISNEPNFHLIMHISVRIT